MSGSCLNFVFTAAVCFTIVSSNIIVWSNNSIAIIEVAIDDFDCFFEKITILSKGVRYCEHS